MENVSNDVRVEKGTLDKDVGNGKKNFQKNKSGRRSD